MNRIEITPESLSVAVPPGETIREYLESARMSQVDLAERTGIDKKTINLVIKGNATVTQDTAIALERVFENRASFWLSLEANYQAVVAANKQKQSLSKYVQWMELFPYTAMVKAKWVEPATKAEDRVDQLLKYFKVTSPDSWKKVYGDQNYCASYRKSPAVKDSLPIVAAWLRRGESIAENQVIESDFDEKKFRKILPKIRKLTFLTCFDEIQRELINYCSSAGVAYAATRELPKLGVNGAMRWFGKRPVIQQTLRGKSHDIFWFTFYHEAWHVLQKQKKRLFLEGDSLCPEDQIREAEANAMAGEFLIPQASYAQFLGETPKKTVQAVKDFASKIEIHPGIVVGRLQKEGRLRWQAAAHNRLKMKLEWPTD
ncbi:HigA family addiction module antitoxin [Akkermansiaceae bacterium]|nr:HigA family addiction module antitoxin [Akkermansiaceae bacterium]